jgi:YjcQ protein
VLIALYTEYQKDIPIMGSITSELIGLDQAQFNFVLSKLNDAGLITNIKVHYTKTTAYPLIVYHNVSLTPLGIAFVEEKLGINPYEDGEEKSKSRK